MDATKLRVVIVEDSAMIRARLAETLTEIPNVEIIGEAETEAEAVALLRQGEWDAAVLDLQLKKGTGLGVLKAIAADKRPATAKVIVFTNFAFPQYKDRSLQLGADYFSTSRGNSTACGKYSRILPPALLPWRIERRFVAFIVTAQQLHAAPGARSDIVDTVAEWPCPYRALSTGE